MRSSERAEIQREIDRLSLLIDIDEQKQRVAESLDAKIRGLGVGSFEAFVRRAWPIVEPKPMVWNWHMTILCDELESVAPGYRTTRLDPCQRLVICVPPGTAKSLLVSVFFPAYRWLCDPSERILAISGQEKITTRDSRKMRDLVTSRWFATMYRDAHGVPFKLRDDMNQKISFETKERGVRSSLPIGGGITGERCDGMIVDDPLDAKKAIHGSAATVAARMKSVNEVMASALENRLNDPLTSWQVLIMQRLAPGDPSQVWLDDPDVRNVVFPMIYDSEIEHLHPEDPRSDGQLLMPQRFPRAFIDRMIRKMGSRHWLAQYQQTVKGGGGGTFKAKWLEHRFNFYRPRDWPAGDPIYLSVDCTFKKTDSSDFVAIAAIGVKDGDFWVCDMVIRRMTFVETLVAIRDMYGKWARHISGVIVEGQANGPAVLDTMRRQKWMRVPLTDFQPAKYGSKEMRASVGAIQWERGGVKLPTGDQGYAEWVADCVSQHVDFPGGLHDDAVDAVSQFLLWWGDRLDDQLEAVRESYGFDVSDPSVEFFGDFLGF